MISSSKVETPNVFFNDFEPKCGNTLYAFQRFARIDPEVCTY